MCKQLLQHLQRAELGERGDVEAIEVVEHLEATEALQTVEGEKVHGAEVHAYEARDEDCLLGTQIVAMQRWTTGETGALEIETIARLIIIQVGIKPQEAGKAHEEDKVEIGNARPLASIEDADGVHQISKEGGILSLFAQSVMEKLAQEKGDGRFVGIEWQ